MLLRKFYLKGFYGIFFAFKTKIINYIKIIFPNIFVFEKIKRSNFIANFKFEGETKIKIPRFSIFGFLSNNEKKINL